LKEVKKILTFYQLFKIMVSMY